MTHDSTYYGPTSEDYENARKAKDAFIRVGKLEERVSSLEATVEDLSKLVGKLVRDREGAPGPGAGGR